MIKAIGTDLTCKNESNSEDEATGSGHVLVACDKFKGTLTSVEVAECITAGVHSVEPDVPVEALLVADGGDGTLLAVEQAGFELVPVTVAGPTGKDVRTSYATRGDIALVELADACGLGRLPGGQLEPLVASSRGAGQALSAALSAGYRDLVLAVGGSASSDGGAGMMSALGAVLLDRDGRELPDGGAALIDLETLELSGLDPAIAESRIILASDVDNPLLGMNGAVAIYGPQKGATGRAAERLERGLQRWAHVVNATTGVDRSHEPGAGAAGGVGFAALSLLGAEMKPGIELLLDLVEIDERLVGARLVVTGEGSIDQQTLQGKTPIGVARAARAAGVPVVAVCGRSTLGTDQLAPTGIEEIFALTDLESDLSICIARAKPLLTQLAADLTRARLSRGGGRE